MVNSRHVHIIYFCKVSSRQGRNKCAIFKNRAYDSGLFYKSSKCNLVCNVKLNNHGEETYQYFGLVN